MAQRAKMDGPRPPRLAVGTPFRGVRRSTSNLVSLITDSFLEDTPYEPAPASPLGPALLDDHESNMLDNFFTTINSNPFANDFWFTGSQNDTTKSLGFPGFDWSSELPPTFEGSTTSLPQPSFSHRGVEKPVDVLPEHSNQNPDIVAAASMLYQNGVHGHEISTAFGSQPQSAFSNMDHPLLKGNGKDQQQNGHLPTKRPNALSRTHLPIGVHTTKMFFDVHEPISPERQFSTKARPLHWGSDSSFMDQGYVAPPDQPDEEQRTQELLDNLECLEPQSSAANTRAPTPDRVVHHHPIPWVDTGAVNHMNGLRQSYADSMEDLSHPKKKQRLLIKEEDDKVSDDESRRRSKRSRGSNRQLSNDATRKPRASQSSKAPRENLTEEQKRSNHILSEQKRRNLIRQGFEDLCTLVPGLKGGGFSKSAMLTQAADWLEEILRGNDILRTQLADLKTMNGLVMPR
ncbi:basic helix-loop-helix domain-containing protein [Aspergillus lucknowensis]|uniref:BHLH domain-containing protein n=1 Tax=Aspergillus lucknowensis TaxID=176173 RepID=A0ABR4M881_9EURO